ncbi:MAG: hypothetical protein NTW87_31645, partial [Planctomycetota bacterium]|nr:hypothetical protein [Planctomycetota bacterium]
AKPATAVKGPPSEPVKVEAEPQRSTADQPITETAPPVAAAEKPQTVPPTPQPAAPAAWHAIFDGRTLDCLKGQGRGAWRVENGAIVSVPGVNDAAQTVQQFGDGDLRVRFEITGTDGFFFVARQGNGGFAMRPDGAQMAAMAGKPQELVFTCRGENVTATVNGQPVALNATGKPLQGSLQFNVRAGSTLRVVGIEHSDVPGAGSAAAAAPVSRPDTARVMPWQPIFDGRTPDCLNGQGQGAWRVENGALVSVPGVQQAVPTVREFGDGQIRICFEVVGVKYMDIKVRNGPDGGICAEFDKPQLAAMGNKPQELLFTCRGTDVSATVNGQPMQLGGEARPLKGRVRFYVGNGTLRVLSLEYRDLPPAGAAAPAATPPPVFPPVVAKAQRAAIEACDRVLEALAKKDLDPGARLEQALRLAKAGAAPGLQPLAPASPVSIVLEKAQALYEQATATIAKQPPTEPVRVEKLNLTGTVARVAGGKAFIKSEGMELPVDLALLPETVFLKALAFDETKPAGIADKAAYFFGMGNPDGAQQLLKRVKKEDLPAWAALFEQRTAWARLLKFEASIGTIETTVTSSRPADALATLNSLKNDYPELVEANKERIAYLLTQAEGPKK